MAATFEIVQGVLFITGSLDRAADPELQKALDKYASQTPAEIRVADLSNVRWLAPSGAKALIAAGQNATEKNGKVRVLASRHVLQTLNLLGAKTWLTIEGCLIPNSKPGTEPAPDTASASSAASPAVAAASSAELAAASTPASGSNTIPAVPSAPPPASAPTPAPAAAEPARAYPSGLAPAVPSSEAPVVARATPGPLAGPAEELSRGALLLRVIFANRRYNFKFSGGDSVMGVVRERVGGPWVLVETTGTRKIINLDSVEYCEIL